jgi:hypothetical protein
MYMFFMWKNVLRAGAFALVAGAMEDAWGRPGMAANLDSARAAKMKNGKRQDIAS